MTIRRQLSRSHRTVRLLLMAVTIVAIFLAGTASTRGVGGGGIEHPELASHHAAR